MDITTTHITLGGVAFLVSLAGSVGALWRFVLKPFFDRSRARDKETDEWRDAVDEKLELLREFATVGDDRERFDRLWLRITER